MTNWLSAWRWGWSLSSSRSVFALMDRLNVEPPDGLEPSTCGLRNRCSTTELRWLDRIARPPPYYRNGTPGSIHRKLLRGLSRRIRSSASKPARPTKPHGVAPGTGVGVGVGAAAAIATTFRMLWLPRSMIKRFPSGPTAKPESTEGGRRVSVLKRQEGAPVLLG